MPTKLIVCLLAACVVAGSGAYLYFDNGSGCGGCPLSKLAKSDKDCPECAALSANAICEGDTSACCESGKVTAKKATCCAEEPVACPATEATTAVFGAVATVK